MTRRLHDLNAESLPRYAYPMVDLIHRDSPDHIIACDRGGRLVGLTVFLLYREMYGTIPTLNRSMDFVKLSPPSVPHRLDSYKEALENRGVNSILFIDDLICTGATQRMANECFSRFDIKFAAVKDLGIGDRDPSRFAGHPLMEEAADPEWDDYVGMIGVDYDKDYNPVIVRSEESLEYRRRISRSVREYARKTA